jgi:2-polyprenyl-6-methoxyphenol hydroxylase-like FAD-dependent oxidoreductase
MTQMSEKRQTMKQLKILICGGGIAGFTLAYWLHQHGHCPIVVEQADGLRPGGYMIDFTGTGWDVIEKMGLVTAIRQKARDFPYLSFENDKGETVTKVSFAAITKALNDKYVALMRHELQEILYEAVRLEVEIRFGQRVTAVSNNPHAAIATFNDGHQESYDLIVGADGIHSDMRQMVFAPDKQYERYLGYYVASYAIATGAEFEAGFVNYWQPNRMVGVYHNADGSIQAFFVFATEDIGHVPPEKRQAILRHHYEGAGRQVETLLAGIATDTPIFLDSVTQIAMPQWSCDRVALVGDAAYCPTLISGQGASLAMGGAYILAEELGQTAAIPTALANYEKRLRPHIEEKQKKARKLAKSFVPRSRARIWLNHIMLKLLFTRPFRSLVSKQFGADTIFTEEL